MSLSSNVLSEIFSYLTLEDLFSVSMVNKKFNKASRNSLFFKSEFLRIWANTCILEPKISNDWKKHCLSGLKLKNSLEKQKLPLVNPSFLHNFYQQIIDCLASPELILPEFRKDTLNFPTILQDLLGNSCETYEVNSVLTCQFFESFEEISKKTISDCPEKLLTTFILPLISNIEKILKFYCEGIFFTLKESANLLERYLEAWSFYSMSIKNLHILFSPLTEMIKQMIGEIGIGENDFMEPNFYNFMCDVWRTSVFNKLDSELYQQFFKEFKKIDFYNGKIDQCKAFIEGVLDITLNEVTIHFKNYSKLLLEGPYKFLHEFVLKKSKKLYSKNNSSGHPPEIINFIFPQVTSIEINAMCNEIRKKNNSLEEKQKIDDNLFQDLVIEFRAKKIGITADDIFKYSQCKKIKIIDIASHIQGFQPQICK